MPGARSRSTFRHHCISDHDSDHDADHDSDSDTDGNQNSSSDSCTHIDSNIGQHGETLLAGLGETVAGCERIVGTCRPLGYARHTSRFMR